MRAIENESLAVQVARRQDREYILDASRAFQAGSRFSKAAALRNQGRSRRRR